MSKAKQPDGGCPSNRPAALSQQPRGVDMSRRAAIGFGALVAAKLLVDVSPADADMLRDMAKRALLPDIEPQTALVMLLDARGVLLEIKVGDFGGLHKGWVDFGLKRH